MSSSLRKPKKVPRIGSLLVESGIIASGPLEEAARVARESNQPIGRVLLMLEYLRERELKSALLAQSLIAHGLIAQDTAIEALKTAAVRRISLDEALDEMGVTPVKAPERHELGELLLAAGFLTRPLYDEALRTRQEAGVLLGRFLVLRGAITNAILGAALEVLVLVRDGRLTREQAAQTMTEMRTKHLSLQAALAELGILAGPAKRAKLGDILSMGGLITDSESLDAVELALEEKRMFGEILTQSGMVAAGAIETALALQEMVSKGILDRGQASEVLRQVSKRGISINQVTEELAIFESDPALVNQILNLLTNAGLISDQDVRNAVASNKEYARDPVRALLSSGIIDRELHLATLDCLDRLAAEELKIEQCIILLQWCQRSRCSLAEAMAELNMGPRADEQEAAPAAAPRNLPLKRPAIFDRGLDPGEKRQLALIGIFFAACGWAVIAIVPKDLQIYLLWSLVVILSITLMGVGRSLGTGREVEQERLQMRIQAARSGKKKKLPGRGSDQDLEQ